MIIYKTTNLVNNKIYIGQTNGNRKNYKGGGKLLKLAFNKYGRDSFKFEVIIKGDFNQVLIDDLERHYIRLYNSTNLNIGYNLESGGFGHIGKKHSVETKLKMSLAAKGKKKTPFSETHKLNISKAKKNIPWKRKKTVEEMITWRKSRVGKPLTIKHKKALSLARLTYLNKPKPSK